MVRSVVSTSITQCVRSFGYCACNSDGHWSWSLIQSTEIQGVKGVDSRHGFGVNIVDTLPRGSKYPIFQVSGSKNHTLNGFWDQSP